MCHLGNICSIGADVRVKPPHVHPLHLLPAAKLELVGNHLTSFLLRQYIEYLRQCLHTEQWSIHTHTHGRTEASNTPLPFVHRKVFLYRDSNIYSLRCDLRRLQVCRLRLSTMPARELDIVRLRGSVRLHDGAILAWAPPPCFTAPIGADHDGPGVACLRPTLRLPWRDAAAAEDKT